MTWTSARDANPTALVSLLLERSGSVVPAATATVATLTSGLLPTGALRPVATNVALPPARRSTVVAIVPVPDGDVHLDPLLAVHVHVTPVNGTGNESVTEAPTAVLGPLLTTATVHVNEVPAAAAGTLGVFVNERSATTDDVSVAVPVSFAAFGSTGVLDWRVAVLTRVPGSVTRPVTVNISVRVAGTAPSVQMPVPAS